MPKANNFPAQAQQAEEHFRHWDRELDKAAVRITAQSGLYGGRQAAAVGWLLRFCQEDLTTLGAGGLVDRELEVLRFTVDAGLPPGEDGHLIPDGARVSLEGPRFPLKFEHLPSGSLRVPLVRVPVPLPTLQQIQRDIGAALANYVTERRVWFPIVAGRLYVMHWGGLVLETESIISSLYFQLAHLLHGFGARVRRCSVCPRFFLAGRTDKQFCSGRCQAKHYNRVARGTPPERFGKRGRPGPAKRSGTATPRDPSRTTPNPARTATGGTRHGTKRG